MQPVYDSHDAVIFADEFTETMYAIEGGLWTFPVDDVRMDGSIRPIPDVHAAQQVEVLVQLLSGHGITVNEVKVGMYVSIPFTAEVLLALHSLTSPRKNGRTS